MRSDLDSELVNKIAAEEATLVLCTKLDFAGNSYYNCAGNIPVYIGSQKYSPNGVRLDSIEAEGNIAAMNCRLSIPNTDDAISSVLLAQDCRKDPVTVYWAALEDYGAVANSGDAYGIFFQGKLDDFDIDWEQDIVTLKCVNELADWQRRNLRAAEVTCKWAVGSIECGYYGGSPCDQTFARCTALGNTMNYEGALYMPQVSEQQLWWGKTATNKPGSSSPWSWLLNR